MAINIAGADFQIKITHSPGCSINLLKMASRHQRETLVSGKCGYLEK